MRLATSKSQTILAGFARPKCSARSASGLPLLFASQQLVGAKFVCGYDVWKAFKMAGGLASVSFLVKFIFKSGIRDAKND